MSGVAPPPLTALHGLRPVHLLLFLPWLVLLGWMADVAWFLTDDAFISFRYARNLLEGHGLVFNPGERVEGYSNFLWVLELAALWGAFGLRPEHAAPWLSVAFTAATLAAMLWQVARRPSLAHRGLVGWMALGLVCGSATFAVWTSGGGLETRQFTFFVVLAVVCLGLYRDSRRALLVVSWSLAAASLTRPEGPLFAACCFGWYVLQRRADTGRWAPQWGAAACLAGPCVLVVASHYLWRYGYYGEWLPNTYYAKHVRAWYEMGVVYLCAAALETGLYLLLPLAVVSLVQGWRRRRCLAHALPLLCIVLHMAYVARIGGDHFGDRPLDFYWPLLAVPAAEGVVHVGVWASGALRRLRPFASRRPAAMVRACAVAVFLPVLFYSSAMQGALLFEGARIDKYKLKLHLTLGEENAGWLLAAPGMPMLAAISDHLRMRLVRQVVGVRYAEVREFADGLIQSWRPCRDMERGVIPDDAVALAYAAGIPPYYVPDLKFVDYHGLTDATIARNPSTSPNHERHMAHERSPPSGYIEKRGVNITVHPMVCGESPGAYGMRYAAKVGRDLWMPFDSPDHQWVVERFTDRTLRMNIHPTDPSGNLLKYDAKPYVGDRFLQHFEGGFGDWRLEGDAVTNHGQHEHYTGQQPIHRNVGPGFLTSYHPTEGDRAVGRALSPEFTVTADRLLVFRIAGGESDGVGVRLLADGEQVAVWRGRNTERFEQILHPLADIAGKRLQLELFDHETGGWGHIMLDHVLVLRPQSEKHR